MLSALPLILASASPRRRELLQQIGVRFTVVTAGVDETPLPAEQPVPYTVRLARAKAEAVQRIHPAAAVIGADTTVTLDGELYGKPASVADARGMLQRLQGRTHEVTTGFAVSTAAATVSGSETTRVTLAVMTDEEISAYAATGEPMDKAGAYAIQGVAARWVTRIEGDYSNVVGLPLARLYMLLRELDFISTTIDTL